MPAPALTLNADGSYSYVANQGAKGSVTDKFYEVSDGTSAANATILACK